MDDPPATQRLRPITGQFRDAVTERDFRASVLRDMQRNSRTALMIAAGLTLMFGISDYNFLGHSPELYQLLGLRIVMAGGCIALGLILHGSDALLVRPWLYSVAPLLIATGCILILGLRPNTLPTILTAVIVVVIGLYLFVPNLVSGMIAANLYLTAGFLAGAWYWAGLGPVALLTIALLLLLANIVGYGVALRLARLEREHFALLQAERASKERLLEEVAGREILERQLRTMAETDELTGLSNRRHFTETAAAALALARRRGIPMSLCLIDVDHFKAINDAWGHAVGDEVLREVGRTCQQAVRQGELFGRFGGEEFVAAFPGSNAERARDIAERLRERVEALRFGDALAGLRATVTIGVAEVEAEEEGFEPALKRADDALYRGKRAGRNTVRVGRLGEVG